MIKQGVALFMHGAPLQTNRHSLELLTLVSTNESVYYIVFTAYHRHHHHYHHHYESLWPHCMTELVR